MKNYWIPLLPCNVQSVSQVRTGQMRSDRAWNLAAPPPHRLERVRGMAPTHEGFRPRPDFISMSSSCTCRTASSVILGDHWNKQVVRASFTIHNKLSICANILVITTVITINWFKRRHPVFRQLLGYFHIGSIFPYFYVNVTFNHIQMEILNISRYLRKIVISPSYLLLSAKNGDIKTNNVQNDQMTESWHENTTQMILEKF